MHLFLEKNFIPLYKLWSFEEQSFFLIRWLFSHFTHSRFSLFLTTFEKSQHELFLEQTSSPSFSFLIRKHATKRGWRKKIRWSYNRAENSEISFKRFYTLYMTAVTKDRIQFRWFHITEHEIENSRFVACKFTELNSIKAEKNTNSFL